jgi:hypothetical protein
MAELGEAVAVIIVKDISDECPFTHDDGPFNKKNDLVNSPSTLGANLGSGGEPYEVSFTFMGSKKTLQVGQAAHHLVPGDAAVNKATALLKYVRKSDGEIKGDIGYGVNHANNGVWLPGSYHWDVDRFGKWKEQDTMVQYVYAYHAMKHKGRQFHDAHTDYNAWCRRTLEKIRVKMLEMQRDCDKCTIKKPFKPPYGLVAIIDRLSGRLRSYVTGPPSKWKPPFCTSRWAVLYGAGMTPESIMNLAMQR